MDGDQKELSKIIADKIISEITQTNSADVDAFLIENKKLEKIQLESVMQNIDDKLLLSAEMAVNTAREKVLAILGPSIRKVKKEYQDEIDRQFLECKKIIAGFKGAVHEIRFDPRFDVFGSLEMFLILAELDTVNSPRSPLDAMTGLNSEILKKHYKAD